MKKSYAYNKESYRAIVDGIKTICKSLNPGQGKLSDKTVANYRGIELFLNKYKATFWIGITVLDNGTPAAILADIQRERDSQKVSYRIHVTDFNRALKKLWDHTNESTAINQPFQYVCNELNENFWLCRNNFEDVDLTEMPKEYDIVFPDLAECTYDEYLEKQAEIQRKYSYHWKPWS